MTYAAYLRMDSEHAYVRHADGITYECPWQTRPRCLLACRWRTFAEFGLAN